LPGVRLDGAALRTAGGRLVVGLTLRDPRLESFWFTLMHLVAHIFLHIGPNWTCNGFVPVTYLIMPPWLRTRAG